MKVIEYVRQLAPVQERRELMSALKQLKDTLRGDVLPNAVLAQETFGKDPLKSTYAKELDRALRRKANYRGSVFDALVESVNQLSANLEVLEAEVKRQFSFSFSRSSLSYNRLQVMRYIEGAMFYTRYFSKLMLRLVAEESLMQGKASPMDWAKAERQWLDDGQAAFIGFFPLAHQGANELKTTLSRASSAEVNEDTHEVAVSSIGERKLDPMGFYGDRSNLAHLNPFFALGKMVVEFQAAAYKQSKEEHQAVQLRLQEYRELAQENKTDPKLQKLIQYTEQRVERLDYEIARIEEANRMD